MRALPVLAVVLVLAACGGGGGGTRLSRDAYVTRADAICATVAQERKKLGLPSSIAAIPAYVDRAKPLLDTALTQLHALRPPKDMEQDVDALLHTADQARDILGKLRAAAKKGDAIAVAQVGSQAMQLESEVKSRARALGVTGCTAL